MRIYKDKTQQEEFETLGLEGHTGSFNDRQRAYLQSIGGSGSLADMFMQYAMGIITDGPPVIATVVSNIPDVTTDVGSPVVIDGRQWFTGASPAITALNVVGSLPTGVTQSGFNFTFTPTSIGTVSLQVTATNTAGTSGTATIDFIGEAVAGGVSSITSGGVTIPFSASTIAGEDALGQPYAVGSFSITEPTPVQTTEGGLVVNGSMFNPQRTTDPLPTHAYDGRLTDDFSAGLTPSFPLAFTTGDSLIKVVSELGININDKIGVHDEIVSIKSVSREPTATEVLSGPLDYSGKAEPEFYTLTDFDTWYDNRPVFSSVGLDFAPFADVEATILQNNPIGSQIYAASGEGVEINSPYRYGGYKTTGSNYPREPSKALSDAMNRMYTDLDTKAQTEQLWKHHIRQGLNYHPTMYLTGGQDNGPDGGFHQEKAAQVIFAMHMTGRDSEIPDVMNAMGGLWKSFFYVDQTFLDNIDTPHDSASLPAVSRRRTLGTQTSGTGFVDIPVVQGSTATGEDDWHQVRYPVGTQIIRESDSLTYTLSAASDLGDNGSATTMAMPINETNGFSSGDVVYMKFPASSLPSVGDADWALRGHKNWWTPFGGTLYRNVPELGCIVALQCEGLVDPTLQVVYDYMKRSLLTNEPDAANDYPGTLASFQGLVASYNGTLDLLNDNTTAIEAITQLNNTPVTAPTVTPTINWARSDSATTDPLTANGGAVIGINATTGTAPLTVNVSAENGYTLRVQMQESDGTARTSWTTMPVVTSGFTEATIEVSPNDADLYPVVEFVDFPAEPAVTFGEWRNAGTVMLLQGQSQVRSFDSFAQNSSITLDAAATGKCYANFWQSVNAGSTAIAERLEEITNSSSDILIVWANQAVKAMPTRDRHLLIVDAVSGTGLIHLLEDDGDQDGTVDGQLTGRTLGGDVVDVNKRSFDDMANKQAKAGRITAYKYMHNGDPFGDYNTATRGDDILANLFRLSGNEGLTHDLTEVLQDETKIIIGWFWRHARLTNHLTSYSQILEASRTLTTSSLAPLGGFVEGYAFTSEMDPAHPIADPAVMTGYDVGTVTALDMAKAIGDFTEIQPYFDNTDIERSADGTQLSVGIVYPAGYTLTAGGSLTGWEFVENGVSTGVDTGFTGALVGDRAVFTKDTGTWEVATLLAGGPLDNGTINSQFGSPDPVEEKRIRDGRIFATSSDVLGDGILVAGTLSGGLHIPITSGVNLFEEGSVVQASAPVTGVPTILNELVTDTGSANVTSLAVNLASGSSGNLQEVHMGWGREGDTSVATPAGWTKLVEQEASSGFLNSVVYYRLLDGTTASETVETFTTTASADGASAWCYTTDGTNIGDVASGLRVGAGSNTHTGIGVTTTNADSLVIQTMLFRTTIDAGNIASHDVVGASDALIFIGKQDVAVAGAVAGESFTTADLESQSAKVSYAIWS